MAIVRFGGGVSEIRGSIAGTTYSRSRAGAVARNRIKPVNPNTPAQSLARSWMQIATDGFRELSPSEVDAWNEFASTQTRFNRLGEPYTPSGKQLFTECFLNILSIGDPGPPVLSMLEGNPNLPSVTMGPPSIGNEAAGLTELVLLGLSSTYGDNLVVQATGQMPSSVSNFQKYFRQIGVFGITDPLPILTAYTTYFPTTVSDPVEGNVIGIRVSAVNSDNGLASEWNYAKVAIPAEV